MTVISIKPKSLYFISPLHSFHRSTENGTTTARVFCPNREGTLGPKCYIIEGTEAPEHCPGCGEVFKP